MGVTKHYRQTEYGDRYAVSYERQSDGTIGLHCSQHPEDPFGKGVAESHLYSSGKICVREGYEPRSMDRAEAIAAAFIDGYSEYVRTGETPTRTRRYNV